MIVGDAFITTNQESAYAIITQAEELHGPQIHDPRLEIRGAVGPGACDFGTGSRRDRPWARHARAGNAAGTEKIGWRMRNSGNTKSRTVHAGSR